MAFIRRVRTPSGATGVQIVEYVADRRQRVVKHVGSARTPAELGVVMAKARTLLAEYEHAGQGSLDLGVDVEPKVGLIEPAPAVGVLEVSAPAPTRPVAPVLVEPGRVVGTASQLLFEVLAGLYDQLGFTAVADDVFRDLVIARVAEPTSLLDVGRVQGDLGREPASYSTLRRTLERCRKDDYRSQLAELCFTYAQVNGEISLVLYDVTTLYFEAEKEDELRKVGFSKERRVDPQIVVGLLVDRAGFPLEIACFEGNKAEKHTILPVIEAFAERHKIENMVVVADAGMLSAANLTSLDDAGYRFIVGSRVTKAPIDLESHFRWYGDAFTDGQVIDTLTPKIGKNTHNDTAVRAEPVWDPATHPSSWRAVWAYSAKRSARDNKTLTAQENRARAVIDGDSAARKPRFVKATTSGFSLDDAALARARRLVGLKGYVTNIPAHLSPATEVIASYHDLWNVETSFRMSKTDLAARPLFARRRDAIEAHLTIVFTALALSRTIQNRSGLALRRVLRTLRPLRSATLAINGAVQTFPPHLDADQRALVDVILRDDVTHQGK
ncbi:MAG: IS1634 family transposase [Cellulomonas sp.]